MISGNFKHILSNLRWRLDFYYKTGDDLPNRPPWKWTAEAIKAIEAYNDR